MEVQRERRVGSLRVSQHLCRKGLDLQRPGRLERLPQRDRDNERDERAEPAPAGYLPPRRSRASR